MATKMVTVKAKVGVFLSGGVGLAAGETARISETAARGYPPGELEIVGESPDGEDRPAGHDGVSWASDEAKALAEAGSTPAPATKEAKPQM